MEGALIDKIGREKRKKTENAREGPRGEETAKSKEKELRRRI
jgi:hypothetical protein